ncbi:MAG: ABC transporter permease [Lachnospiraceae bacterium]|nr:ABC transporter permease [Lachnospiraceae bacterium]
MENQKIISPNMLKSFFFENKVALMFLIISGVAFWASGMTTVMFFNELSVRIGRDTFLVLSLLIPVVAGLGLNFGIVIGAMSAQIALFFVVLFGGSGASGLFTVALVATPIAILLGYLVGRLFNSMKGSEMIGGMIVALFAAGFYQFFFLFFLGGIVPIESRMMTSSGIGVLNVIDIGASPSYMRQALDNVTMLHILTVAFWAMLVFVAIMLIVRLVKKQAITMKGPLSIRRPIFALIVLAIVYIASGFGGMAFVNGFTLWLYQDRLNALYALWWGGLLAALLMGYAIIKAKVVEKSPGVPIKPIAYLVIVIIAFLLSLWTPVYTGLENVGLPVLTYLIIIGLCVAIKWFLNTRLGQNMRSVGQSRPVATAAGINVDRTRIIAMIMSTVLAAYGQIIMLQNFGVMNTYSAHENVGLFAIAAFLVGGASVAKASIKNAILGVILFHSLFILAPFAGANLMDSTLIGEYFREFVAYAVIALALVMHAWQRKKKRKAKENE